MHLVRTKRARAALFCNSDMARRKRKAKRKASNHVAAAAPQSSAAAPPSAAAPRPCDDRPEVSRSPAAASTAAAAVLEDQPPATAEPAVDAPSAEPDPGPVEPADWGKQLQQTVAVELDLVARDQQLAALAAELQSREEALRVGESRLREKRRRQARQLWKRRRRSTATAESSPQTERLETLLDGLTSLLERGAATSTGEPSADYAAIDHLQARLEEQQETIDALTAERDEHHRHACQLQSELDQQHCQRLFDIEPNEAGNEALLEELTNTQARVADLEQQNQDLAARLAEHNVRGRIAEGNTNTTNESLSWEERKQLILQRLENEELSLEQGTSADAEETRQELESLRALVKTTDAEIQRRDEEIAELRQLLEQQSGTVGDVAIGAAAIAGLLDQDDLVREEREKLQQIQSEWQDKLRQAEIEVSLERARLARERQEIEKRNVELSDRMLDRSAGSVREQQQDQSDGSESKSSRKWLARLGLDK